MQIAFLATCLLAGLVFWRRRRIDPMLLGFCACLVYFSPGFVGRIELNYPTLLFRARQGPLHAIVAVLAGWWGFYVHRNDLLIEIGIVKLVVYIGAGALAIGWCLENTGFIHG